MPDEDTADERAVGQGPASDLPAGQMWPTPRVCKERLIGTRPRSVVYTSLWLSRQTGEDAWLQVPWLQVPPRLSSTEGSGNPGPRNRARNCEVPTSHALTFPEMSFRAVLCSRQHGEGRTEKSPDPSRPHSLPACSIPRQSKPDSLRCPKQLLLCLLVVFKMPAPRGREPGRPPHTADSQRGCDGWRGRRRGPPEKTHSSPCG